MKKILLALLVIMILSGCSKELDTSDENIYSDTSDETKGDNESVETTLSKVVHDMDESVVFVDEVFEKRIRDLLAIQSRDIKYSDLAEFGKFDLDGNKLVLTYMDSDVTLEENMMNYGAPEVELTSYEDIRLFVNLDYLYLGYGSQNMPEITNLEFIKELYELEYLFLGPKCNNRDLDDLSALKKLEYLYVDRMNNLSDVDGITNLDSIKSITFRTTEFESLKFIGSLKELEELNIGSVINGETIGDLKHLNKLTSFTYGQAIDGLGEEIIKLTNLETLDVRFHKHENIEFVYELPKLKKLVISTYYRYDLPEGEDIQREIELDISSIKNLEYLVVYGNWEMPIEIEIDFDEFNEIDVIVLNHVIMKTHTPENVLSNLTQFLYTETDREILESTIDWEILDKMPNLEYLFVKDAYIISLDPFYDNLVESKKEDFDMDIRLYFDQESLDQAEEMEKLQMYCNDMGYSFSYSNNPSYLDFNISKLY